jgi:hypothetical protein
MLSDFFLRLVEKTFEVYLTKILEKEKHMDYSPEYSRRKALDSFERMLEHDLFGSAVGSPVSSVNPWKHIQVIAVGDFCQLSPILKGVLKTAVESGRFGTFAFESPTSETVSQTVSFRSRPSSDEGVVLLSCNEGGAERACVTRVFLARFWYA